MYCKLPFWTLSVGLVLVLAPFALSAQQGTLVGTLIGRLDGQPVALADVQILGGSETRTVRTNAQGQYSVELPAGTYDLIVRNTLYERRTLQQRTGSGRADDHGGPSARTLRVRRSLRNG